MLLLKMILCERRFSRSMIFKGDDDDEDDGIGKECHHFKLLWRLFKGEFNTHAHTQQKRILRRVTLRFQLKQLWFKRILSEYIWANKSSTYAMQRGLGE